MPCHAIPQFPTLVFRELLWHALVATRQFLWGGGGRGVVQNNTLPCLGSLRASLRLTRLLTVPGGFLLSLQLRLADARSPHVGIALLGGGGTRQGNARQDKTRQDETGNVPEISRIKYWQELTC